MLAFGCGNSGLDMDSHQYLYNLPTSPATCCLLARQAVLEAKARACRRQLSTKSIPSLGYSCTAANRGKSPTNPPERLRAGWLMQVSKTMPPIGADAQACIASYAYPLTLFGVLAAGASMSPTYRVTKEAYYISITRCSIILR